MRPLVKLPEGLAFTPKYMMRGLNSIQWMHYKKQQIAEMADINKDKEAFLNSQPHPKVSYYKGIITIIKGKNGTPTTCKISSVKEQMGSYSNPYQILNKNINKNHWTGEVRDAHTVPEPAIGESSSA